MSDESDCLPFLDGEIHSLDDPVFIVFEPNVPVFDRVVQGDVAYRVLGVLYGIFGREYLVDTLHGCETALYGISRFGKVFGRIDNAVKDDKVIDEFPGVDDAVSFQYKCAAKPQDDGDGRSTQKFAHGVCQCLPASYPVGRTVEFVIYRSETLTDTVFGVEGLDDAQPAEGLFDLGHQATPLLLGIE